MCRVSDLKKKVFVLDDHPIVRQGLAELISQEPDLAISGDSDDPRAALEAFGREVPDIVVVDLSLDDSDGLDFIRTVRKDYPGVAVLVLTMHDESFFAERALRAGASGYLTKQEASEKVLIAIRSLLGGDIFVSDRISPKLVERLLNGGALNDDPLMGRLSNREQEVFRRIGRGQSIQEISRDLDLSAKTVETYRGHIKEKLFLKDSRELTQYATRWVLSREEGDSPLDS